MFQLFNKPSISSLEIYSASQNKGAKEKCSSKKVSALISFSSVGIAEKLSSSLFLQ
jgi:hypothetical protein